MAERPYERFSEDELILRDHLATDRTVLANERTLLAYVRTALAFLVSGVGLLKFFDDPTVDVLAWLFNLCSVVVIGIGVRRYRTVARTYDHLRSSQRVTSAGVGGAAASAVAPGPPAATASDNAQTTAG